MRVNSRNKDSIEKMHLLTGENKEKVRQFFESLSFLIVTDFLEDETTNVPFLGDIKICHTGDESVKNGKRAKLSLEFDADEILQRNVGQVIDGETSDIEKSMMGRIRNAIGEYLNS